MAARPEEFIAGMRQLAAGVSVITTAHRGRRAGLTATAVCSVSAAPPQLLACINRSAEAHDLIRAAGLFAVNVLASHQRPLAERFSGVLGLHGPERFAAGTWTGLATGAPVLDPCLAAFDCVVTEAVSAATHTVFIGRVEAVRTRPDLSPLLYVEGDYRLLNALMG
jgi:flavin reductase (DIM6/NTAB) family NADH-FMN oxidoreductase RutF